MTEVADSDPAPAGPFRFLFAGDVVESVVNPRVLPAVDQGVGAPVWRVVRAAPDDAAFRPWAAALADHAGTAEGWADLRAEGLLLSFPGHATFLIDADGATVRVVPDPMLTDYSSHLLVDHVAPRRFGVIGEHALHATAVAVPTPRGRQTLGFFATSGMGKSTLAMHMVSSGASFVADDCLLLRASDPPCETPCDPASGFVAVPSYAGARLWADAAAGVSGIGQRTTVEPWGKGQVQLRDRFEAGPIPLCALIELERAAEGDGEVETPVLERLSTGRATVALVGTYFLNEPGGLSSVTLLTRASALARTVPVYRLTYPHGFAHLGAVVERLRDEFAFTLPAGPQGA